MNDPYTDDPYQPRIINLPDFGAERFTGKPPEVEWLVTDTIPKRAATLLAAMGDTGKGYKTLEIAFKVAVPPEPEPFKAGATVINLNYCQPVLGGTVAAHGTAVIIAGEDSGPTLHRRLDVIDPHGRRHKYPGKLIIVPLPDAGGPLPLFVQDHNGAMPTGNWKMICDQLVKIPDLQMVSFDPLSNFAQVHLDADNTASQFVMGSFSQLAAETGASVILPHHMKKSKAPQNLAEVREAVRGASGIVDGVRCVYALWQVEEKEGAKVCRSLGVPFKPNRVVLGAVVKSNEYASREIRTFVRSDEGLLIDRTAALRGSRASEQELLDELAAAIIAQAAAGAPFTHTGDGGVFKQSQRLPPSLRDMSRHPLEGLVKKLLDEEPPRIIKCVGDGSNTPRYLDAPGGQFDLGEGKVVKGGTSATPKPAGPARKKGA
jgi:AAA domain